MARTWEQELADRISALRNWLVLIAIVSVAAIGVAIFALAQANDDQTQSDTGVTTAQFDDLQNKVDDLADSNPSSAAISQLKSDVSDLDDRVQKLESAGQDGVTSQQLAALQQQVDQLSQQLDDLQGSTTQ